MSVYVDQSGDGRDGDGRGVDACVFSRIIRDSMEGNDYTEVEGVTNARYRNSDAGGCGKNINGVAAAVVQPAGDDELGAGAAFGILAAVAAVAALAFLVTRRRKTRGHAGGAEGGAGGGARGEGCVWGAEGAEGGAFKIEDREMSLISNDPDVSFFEDARKEDPYANTIDVHMCTSIYCDCNNARRATSFLPVPKRVDMAGTMLANGISPTAVNQVDDAFFHSDAAPGDGSYESESEGADVAGRGRDGPGARKGSIMRVPIRSQIRQEGGRPLTPVNEIAHDSEIDTEMESLADDYGADVSTLNDQTTVPPPPPLAFHPAYGRGSGEVHTAESNDEMSI